jgi:hypothetical protein
MNQKLAWSLFACGLAGFLATLGQFFAGHAGWHELTTPDALSHLLPALASLTTSLAGAFGVGTQPQEPKQ